MNWFRNLQVATKLLVAFGVVLTLIGALGAAAIIDLATMAGNTQDITERWLPGIATLARIDSEATNLQAMATQARDLNALMSGYRVDDAGNHHSCRTGAGTARRAPRCRPPLGEETQGSCATGQTRRSGGK